MPCLDLELEGLDRLELDEEFFIIMEDLRYAKQMYLKEEIIDKGFDAGQFTMYCNTLKGIDIDNYTFDELEEIVNNFQSLVVRNQRRKTRDDVEEKKPIVEVVEKTTRSQSHRARNGQTR